MPCDASQLAVWDVSCKAAWDQVEIYTCCTASEPGHVLDSILTKLVSDTLSVVV